MTLIAITILMGATALFAAGYLIVNWLDLSVTV